jgi:hypothetical protein
MVLYTNNNEEIDQIPSLATGFNSMKLEIAKTGAQ